MSHLQRAARIKETPYLIWVDGERERRLEKLCSPLPRYGPLQLIVVLMCAVRALWRPVHTQKPLMRFRIASKTARFPRSRGEKARAQKEIARKSSQVKGRNYLQCWYARSMRTMNLRRPYLIICGFSVTWCNIGAKISLSISRCTMIVRHLCEIKHRALHLFTRVCSALLYPAVVSLLE